MTTIETTNFVESPDVESVKSFDNMELPDILLRGIYSFGFERPSGIQGKAIIPMSKGRDIIAQAQSGTGKTGTFVIGSLSRVDPSIKAPQVLILVHTHELADQIAKVATTIGSYMQLQVLCAIGGSNIRENIKALEGGAQFIVGTPGRIYDLVNRNVLDRSNIRVLIIDEADQMLEDLFYKQVMCILQKGFPEQTQVALFSATMPSEVIEVANTILRNPVRILMNPEAVPLDGIDQFYIDIQREDHKFECICDLYKHLNITQALIFCNKRQKAELLMEKMSAQGYPISCIHGEMEKTERTRRLNEFRTGATRVLISTDLLARGIDVQQVSLVINYELPSNRENYIHRIGRSGRFGRKGTAINLILPEEEPVLKDLVETFGLNIKPMPQDISKLIV
jgi:translation initiation factor 4A